jgi:hypothetical protein
MAYQGPYLIQMITLQVNKLISSDKSLTLEAPRRSGKMVKDGFEAFLTSLDPSYQSEVREHGTINGLSVFYLEAALTTYIDRHPMVLPAISNYHNDYDLGPALAPFPEIPSLSALPGCQGLDRAMASEKTQSSLKLLARTDIQPIIFFTRCLNDAERNYWLIDW